MRGELRGGSAGVAAVSFEALSPDSEERITLVTSDAHSIVVALQSGETLRRPLRLFPFLAAATPYQRERFEILYGDTIFWPLIGDGLEVSELRERADEDNHNVLERLLSGLPEVDVRQLAEAVHVSEDQMLNYAYGLSTPPDALVQAVREHLHQLARRCREVAERIRD